MITRLEIVNHILFNLGQKITTTLNTQHPDVLQAIGILESADMDFQGRGWWFQKEYHRVLAEDIAGEVILPDETTSVTVIRCPYWNSYYEGPHNARYVERGLKIYDTFEHTFNIGAPLTVNLTLKLPVEDLPHNAKVYLKAKCAEDAVLADDGDKIKVDKLTEKRIEAWQQFKADELKALRVNALNSPAAAQLRYRMEQNTSPSNPYYPGG